MTTKIYKYYLFDFDGTLVDSMPYYAKAMLQILDENGISYPEDIVKTITPLGYGGTADYYLDTFRLPLSREATVSRMLSLAKGHYELRVPLKEGVRETLICLRERGASLNILTASPHDVLDVCLRRLGVYDLFDNIWSCDDFQTTKANPDIYLEVAKRLHITPDEYLFIDDNYHAVATAMKAGVPAYGIYDKSGEDFENALREMADGYLTKLSDLL